MQFNNGYPRVISLILAGALSLSSLAGCSQVRRPSQTKHEFELQSMNPAHEPTNQEIEIFIEDQKALGVPEAEIEIKELGLVQVGNHSLMQVEQGDKKGYKDPETGEYPIPIGKYKDLQAASEPSFSTTYLVANRELVMATTFQKLYLPGLKYCYLNDWLDPDTLEVVISAEHKLFNIDARIENICGFDLVKAESADFDNYYNVYIDPDSFKVIIPAHKNFQVRIIDKDQGIVEITKLDGEKEVINIQSAYNNVTEAPSINKTT